MKGEAFRQAMAMAAIIAAVVVVALIIATPRPSTDATHTASTSHIMLAPQ